MAFPVDNSYIIFKAKTSQWEEKVWQPAKDSVFTWDSNGDPSTVAPGELSTTTTGVTIAAASNSVLVDTSIDIDTADSTHIGLLSATDWSTFNGKANVAGSNREIQFNNSGSMGSDSKFTHTTLTSLGITYKTLNLNDGSRIVAHSDGNTEEGITVECTSGNGSSIIFIPDNISITASQIDFTADAINFGSILAIKKFEQSAQPTTTNIPGDYCAFWIDTDDSKCYLCYNHGGTIKKVELT